MNKKLAAFAFLVSAFSALSANATDLRRSTLDAPDEPIVHTWTGPWLGVIAGINASNTEADFSEAYKTEDGEKSFNFLHVDGLGAIGAFGEVQGGFDYQMGERLVVSLFGGVNISSAKFEASAFDGAISVEQKQDFGAVIGPRVGVLLSPSTMAYIAGGLAFAQIGDVDWKFGSSHGSFKVDDAQIGGFGEVGLESHLSEHASMKLFTRYDAFGDYELKGVEGVKLNNSQLVGGLGLVYKLN